MKKLIFVPIVLLFFFLSFRFFFLQNEAPVHQYEFETAKADYYTEIDSKLTINPNALETSYNFDNMSEEELLTIFYDKEVFEQASSFFEVPHKVEQYEEKEDGTFVQTSDSIHYVGFTKLNEPLAVNIHHDLDVQTLNSKEWYASYEDSSDTFSPYTKIPKDEQDETLTSESMSIYKNPYKQLADALSKKESIIRPTGEGGHEVEFTYKTKVVNGELSYYFYLSHNPFFLSEPIPEFNGFYKFSFDENMNLIRFKHIFEMANGKKTMLIKYPIYYETIDDAMKELLHEDLYSVYDKFAE